MLQGQDILWIQQLVRQVPTSQHMVDYAVDLVRATRPKEPPSPDFVKNWLAWGAGPRAAQNMILGAKARAILHGRFAVAAEDIRTMAYPVLRHRIFTNFNADAEGIDVDQVIEKILQTVPEPTYGETIAVGKPRTDRQPVAQQQAQPQQPSHRNSSRSSNRCLRSRRGPHAAADVSAGPAHAHTPVGPPPGGMPEAAAAPMQPAAMPQTPCRRACRRRSRRGCRWAGRSPFRRKARRWPRRRRAQPYPTRATPPPPPGPTPPPSR